MKRGRSEHDQPMHQYTDGIRLHEMHTATARGHSLPIRKWHSIHGMIYQVYSCPSPISRLLFRWFHSSKLCITEHTGNPLPTFQKVYNLLPIVWSINQVSVVPHN